MSLYHEVTLSLETLATVWRRENLGDLHNVLVEVPAWRDDDAEREALHTATNELRQRGLLSGRDLHPDFRDTLNLLARPSTEFYGWIAANSDGKDSGDKNSGDKNSGTRDSDERDGDAADGDAENPAADRDTNIAVLIAAIGQNAVLVVRDGDTVHLGPARADGMAETLVGYLPPVRAARGRSINLPEAEVRQLVADRMDAAPGASKPLPADAYNIFGRASMAEDARDLLTVMDQPRTGGGELYVAGRGRSGERRRCQNPVVYVDTQQGRWMTQLSQGRVGERWIVSAPASRQLLIGKLNEMRNTVLS